MDAAGLHLFASPVAERILGYLPEADRKVHFYELYAPDFKAAAMERFARRQLFGIRPIPHVRRDGREAILEISGAPVVDAAGT